jgi:zinc transporter
MSRRVQIELSDNRGLICGFQLDTQGASQFLTWNDALIALETAESPVWLHFNLSDIRARNWIAAADRLPPTARDALLATNARIHSEIAEPGLISLFGDLHYEFDTDPDKLGIIQLYVDQHCLITGRRHPLKAIDRLRQDLLNGLPIATPSALVVHLVEHVVELLSAVIADRGEALDDIEDLILKGRLPEQQRGELGRERRLLARLHRQVRANRQSLGYLTMHLPDWCSADEPRLKRNLERLDGVMQDLELVQERARLLQEEIAGRLEEAVNRNLYVLSIVTTVFLPTTLISGIFGMNVGGLPWLQDNFGFGWVTLLMGTTLAITLVILRRQRFF